MWKWGPRSTVLLWLTLVVVGAEAGCWRPGHGEASFTGPPRIEQVTSASASFGSDLAVLRVSWKGLIRNPECLDMIQLVARGQWSQKKVRWTIAPGGQVRSSKVRRSVSSGGQGLQKVRQSATAGLGLPSVTLASGGPWSQTVIESRGHGSPKVKRSASGGQRSWIRFPEVRRSPPLPGNSTQVLFEVMPGRVTSFQLVSRENRGSFHTYLRAESPVVYYYVSRGAGHTGRVVTRDFNPFDESRTRWTARFFSIIALGVSVSVLVMGLVIYACVYHSQRESPALGNYFATKSSTR